jgi:hypothetical protein
MARSETQKGREQPLDPATWIPRREAARILNVSLPTILRWEGPRFRIASTRDKWGRLSWFINAADVERVRLERLGPTMSEIEVFVLSEIAAGRTASEIVRAGHRVTLDDVERIRNQDARLSGGLVLDAVTMRELRDLLNVESMNGALLLAHVRAMMRTINVLTGRLNGATLTDSR